MTGIPNDDDIRALCDGASPQGGRDDVRFVAAARSLVPALLARAQAAEAELAEIKQAVWDAYATLGFDTDGDPTPNALTYPSFPEFIRRFAQDERDIYDETCEAANEAEIAEAERDALAAQLAQVQAELDKLVTPRRSSTRE